MGEGARRDARKRREGTRNLFAVALAAGMHRLVAHSGGDIPMVTAALGRLQLRVSLGLYARKLHHVCLLFNLIGNNPAKVRRRSDNLTRGVVALRRE